MNRRERTEILVHAEEDFLLRIEERVLERHRIRVLQEPENALVMLKMRETAKKHLFYLGEMLITECKMMIEGSVGLGIVKGNHFKKARSLAIIDAAFNANSMLVENMIEKIEEEKKRQAQLRRKENSRILSTTVDFETMDEEVKA